MYLLSTDAKKLTVSVLLFIVESFDVLGYSILLGKRQMKDNETRKQWQE